MKKNSVKKKFLMPFFLVLSAGSLGACATGSPDYVGSISSTQSHQKQQRTLDNGQINSIIKDLRSEAQKQKAIIKTLSN